MHRSHPATKGIGSSESSIYDKIDYRPMADAPYALDNHALIAMQKLDTGLRYVLNNLTKLDLTLNEVAMRSGYSAGYFKAVFVKHFEMPFYQFVTKLRMRQAAREICDGHYPKGIAKKYGFSDAAGFSKAFRREIGISPKLFYQGNYAVPDMPMRKQLGGIPITLEYTIERAFALRGPMAPPPRGAETFLMNELALPYTGAYPQFNAVLSEDSFEDLVGVWNYHPDSGIDYVFGPVEERFDSISVIEPLSGLDDGTQRVVIQGGHYAVFSYPRPVEDRLIPIAQRMLSRFIFQEWVPMNHKMTNTMGFTFERFTPERVYFYLPMKSGMDNTDELREREWNLAQWAHRIDELIETDLNADVLADLEGYSTKNYIDVFTMYYGVTPSAYIRRRRLYLADEQMRADTTGARRDAILAQYRFSSYDQFVRLRAREFGDNLDGEVRSSGELLDLEAYYEYNKDRVAFTICRLKDFRIIGHSIEESVDGHHPHDLQGRVLYWFSHMFPGFERFKPYFAPDEAKLFIWADERIGTHDSIGDPNTEDVILEDNTISRYYVAHFLRDDLNEDDEAELASACKGISAHDEVVPGGYYAVFWTADNLEEHSLEDAFQLLTRCAFGGWIRDNRWRVDFTRRTFVAWGNSKLRFYVPTIG